MPEAARAAPARSDARRQRRSAGLAVPSPDDQRAGRHESRTSRRRRAAPGSFRGGSISHAIEEDIFNLAAAPAGVAAEPDDRRLPHPGAPVPRAGGGASGARRGLVGRSRACPFDLHALLPVPAAILQLGPTDPRCPGLAGGALGDAPTGCARSASGQSRRLAGGCRPAMRVVGYGFFTAGETPQAAIARLGARWPALHFVLQPRPPD